MSGSVRYSNDKEGKFTHELRLNLEYFIPEKLSIINLNTKD